MRVCLETLLPCPIESAWQAVCRSDLLRKVAWPVVTLVSPDSMPIPETWKAGETVRIKPRVFGVFPIGIRTIVFERVDPAKHEIQTREFDCFVKKWNHRIKMCERGTDNTLYVDEVVIDAGWLTPLIWCFAQYFYCHRQRRWRRIATQLAASRTPKT